MRRMAAYLTVTSSVRCTHAESTTAEAVAQVFAGVKLRGVIHGLFCAKTVPPPAHVCVKPHGTTFPLAPQPGCGELYFFVSDYASGVYTARLSTDDGSVSRRLVITR